MASVSESTARSNSNADSYIGSLISLTSKSEIRYEGVLYNINTEESSIGLINVRSFGTEGRKKDGQQIPPSDKVYEYILFRGTDIKDLHVKSSPPVQPSPPINNDPAIIQSHYPHPVATSSSLPSAVSGSLTDPNSHSVQLGLPGSNFQGALPLYQPGGSIGSWGAPPPAPSANGSGLAMPMYWQGYYGAPNGLPNLHQQSLLRPPPGLSMPSSMQQQMQYPNFNPPLPTGSSNLPELPSGLIPASSNLPSVVSVSLPSTLPPAPSASLSYETLPASVANKLPTVSLPAGTPPGILPSLSPLSTSGPDINPAVPPISNKPNAISLSSFPYQNVSQSTPAVVGSSNAIRTESPAPPLVTPGQLLHSGSSISYSSQPSQTSHKDNEVVQTLSTSSPEPSVPVSSEAQAPILPLPGVSRVNHEPNEAPVQIHHGYGYRGRGRGRGAVSSRPVTVFTEEFDFTAMNEKFKKDEVWGHLGKSSKSHSKEKDGDENGADKDDGQFEEDGEASKFKIKPVYNKDDFFDSLSSNALDHDSHNARTRFSMQIKIDTETFGDFVRYRGGRGGRGPMRGGRFRGGYYGRGYGYTGRGRGRGWGMSGHASYD